MKKLAQKGFSVVEGLLLVVLVAFVAGIGYYVYQQSQKQDETSKPQSSVTAPVYGPDNKDEVPLAEKPDYVAYSKAPEGLRRAILKYYTDETPSCVRKGDFVASINKDYLVQQMEEDKYALVTVSNGCEEDSLGGASAIFAVFNGSWVHVESSQSGYLCKDLDKYSVPASLMAECFEGGKSVKNDN